MEKKVCFTIVKHGRKWTQIIIHYDSGRDGQAKVQREKVSMFAEGEKVTVKGELKKEYSRYGTTTELIILSDEEKEEKANAEKLAAEEKWWGYFLENYEKGWIYERAITELHNIGCTKYDEQIDTMKKEVNVKKWWGYFLEKYEEGKIHEKAVTMLHELGYHDKDDEIARCREAIEEAKKKNEMEEKIEHLSLPCESFRDRPVRGQILTYKGVPYEVISSYFHNCDGFSFGVMSETWCDVKVKNISETEKGQEILAKLEEERRMSSVIKKANEKLDSLKRTIKNGSIYSGEELLLENIPGETIIDTFDIYGGGIIIRCDKKEVWLIVNNGRDGDMWSINNIRTSGAGAYAYHIPYDEVKKELEEYELAKKQHKEMIDRITSSKSTTGAEMPCSRTGETEQAD